MKMMKAMKKLKFWTRKKKRKKSLLLDNHPPPPPIRPPPPPPPPFHCQYQYYNPYEPSAPPLPTSSSSSSLSSSSWVGYYDHHETRETIYANPEFNSFASSSRAQAQDLTFGPQDFNNSVSEFSPQDSTMPASSTTTYQQYTVPNPVYGVPIVPQVRRERRGGAFGCVFAFGAHLFRCFFPCFHIRDIKR